MSELNVMDFGTGVGTGSASVDTAAWQAALNAFDADTKKLVVPPAEYLINQELTAPVGLNCAEIVSQGGYDGVGGPVNDGLCTSLKWVGSTDATKAVIRFDQASGVVWRGISINCDYKAGYALQFMSSATTGSSVKNVVELCSIHNAQRDGIIVGEWGPPAVSPGDRQFFGNVFRNLTLTGCGVSGIHINEWNADQQLFDTVMVYLDLNPTSPQTTLNAFWFDYGGQASQLLNCESGGMTVVAGVASSGFAIRNQGNNTSGAGAHGLYVENFWQEGAGGLYYGVTATEDLKAFSFVNCKSFTADPENNFSVYIDKGTSLQIPYTFDTCTFLSDIKIDSSTLLKESLNLQNCSFGDDSGIARGVIDSDGIRTNDGCAAVSISGGVLVLPRYADLVQVTLDQNASVVYGLGVSKRGDRLTIIITRDGTSGRTINFAASGNFSSTPPIPAPTAGANVTSTYSFVSDGTKYYLAGAAL